MRRTLALCILIGFLLTSCASHPKEAQGLVVAATTYPLALFAEAVTEGVPGVSVQAVVNQEISCLHDYTLTTADMRVIEGSDLLLLSGAGLEDFLADALASYRGTTADCSAGVSLLGLDGHTHDHGDSHDHADDPHIWLDPTRAALMVENISEALCAADPEHAAQYRENARTAQAALLALADTLRLGAADACPYLITFHDGFAYFADAAGLTILRAIEEEAGGKTSAKEIIEIVGLIDEYGLPAIYIEENGSDATAQAIARERGVQVRTLTMIMSGDRGLGLDGYLAAIEQNIAALAPPAGGAS